MRRLKTFLATIVVCVVAHYGLLSLVPDDDTLWRYAVVLFPILGILWLVGCGAILMIYMDIEIRGEQKEREKRERTEAAQRASDALKKEQERAEQARQEGEKLRRQRAEQAERRRREEEAAREQARSRHEREEESRREYERVHEAAHDGGDLDWCYTMLGVSTTANMNEIRSAYHRKAKALHPDHGGDEDIMKALNHAYDVLRRTRRD